MPENFSEAARNSVKHPKIDDIGAVIFGKRAHALGKLKGTERFILDGEVSAVSTNIDSISASQPVAITGLEIFQGNSTDMLVKAESTEVPQGSSSVSVQSPIAIGLANSYFFLSLQRDASGNVVAKDLFHTFTRNWRHSNQNAGARVTSTVAALNVWITSGDKSIVGAETSINDWTSRTVVESSEGVGTVTVGELDAAAGQGMLVYTVSAGKSSATFGSTVSYDKRYRMGQGTNQLPSIGRSLMDVKFPARSAKDIFGNLSFASIKIMWTTFFNGYPPHGYSQAAAVTGYSDGGIVQVNGQDILSVLAGAGVVFPQ